MLTDRIEFGIVCALFAILLLSISLYGIGWVITGKLESLFSFSQSIRLILFAGGIYFIFGFISGD